MGNETAEAAALATIKESKLLTYCYLLPIICLIGVVGNVANLSTLANPKLAATSYSFLRALAVADLLCMISTFLFCLLQIAKIMLEWDEVINSYLYNWVSAHSILPAINIPLNIGTYMVMALTLERYLSVCFPIWFRSIHSPRRASLTILASAAIVTCLHVPQFWRGDVVCVHHCNESFHNSSFIPAYSVKQSVLFSTPLYIGYKWVRETLCKFLPIFFIAFMNLGIILAFKKHKELRQRLKNKGTGQGSSAQRENRSLLYLLIGIVILFFICKIPAAINLILISDANKKSLSYAKFRAAANLLEIANHALNFYLFCICSTDYRSTFAEKFPLFGRLGKRLRLTRARFRWSLRQVNGERGTVSSSAESGTRVPTTLAPILRPDHRPTLVDIAEEEDTEVDALLQAPLQTPTLPIPSFPTPSALLTPSFNGHVCLSTRPPNEEEEEIFL